MTVNRESLVYQLADTLTAFLIYSFLAL